jgi:hypothetical protein
MANGLWGFLRPRKCPMMSSLRPSPLQSTQVAEKPAPRVAPQTWLTLASIQVRNTLLQQFLFRRQLCRRIYVRTISRPLYFTRPVTVAKALTAAQQVSKVQLSLGSVPPKFRVGLPTHRGGSSCGNNLNPPPNCYLIAAASVAVFDSI